MQQYKDIKSENPDAVLLFRCGDFYETFFEDAVLVSKELQITLTARGKASGNPVPLAGVPYHSIDGYITKLVHKGFTVAICDQVEDPKKAKGLVKREVVKIITPGTIIEPSMLEETSNNYLVSFGKKNRKFCLAAVELSTGEMLLTSGDKSEFALLKEEFTRISPREILVLNESFEANQPRPWEHLSPDIHDLKISEKEAVDALCSIYPSEHKSKFVALSQLELKTMGILAEHLLDTQRQSLSHIKLPLQYKLGDGMVLDEATLANLELLPNSQNKNIGGTLFEVINRTKTSMGARLLKRWLLKPLIEVKPILKRQKLVNNFYKEPLMLADIREVMKGMPDLERILTKVVLGSRNPRDIQSLALGLKSIPDIKHVISSGDFEGLNNRLQPLPELEEYLLSNMKDELPAILSDGNFVADGVSEELDELRTLLKDGSAWLKKFEELEREKTGIKTLKVKKNSVFGYFIEISKSLTDKAPDHYVRKQTLTNGERYITAELKDYETKVFSAKEKSVAIEKEIFDGLVERVREKIGEIQKIADIVAEIDVLSALAYLAQERDYKCPEITDEYIIDIKNGRHPVVEAFIESGSFCPNDLMLNSKRCQALITGPNMSGKSTYLRQTALIVLLAQIGSFVPAESAIIGVVDRIFTRVGASDNLIRGQSTFMVEMMEASAIIKNATERSLLILDEIGRGTSTFDGLSLAWSILEHINIKIKSRTLFATHYHELTDLVNIHHGLFNLNVGVEYSKETGRMVFMHKIQTGPSNKSYGIEVAKIAGLPGNVIDRAKEILFELEKTEQDEISRVSRVVKEDKGKPYQMSFFINTNELEETIKNLDLNNLTPLEALNTLNRLKGMVDD